MNRIFLFSMAFLLLVSCGENIQYSEYETLPQGWSANKSIAFRYQATDTLQKHDLFIMLRNNNDYPYSNIFLITKMEFPNNQVVVDTLEYEMATTEGKWLGEGASIKDSKLWYKEGVIFPTKGTYTFSIEQADRSLGKEKGVESLQGITEVGFQIEASGH